MSYCWYPRYYGDYMRDTGHLTLIEHGAYTCLLDHYYATRKPLPTDDESLFRICRAFSQSEQSAVKSVTSQFFRKHADGMRNARADREIAALDVRADNRSRAAATAASARWAGHNDETEKNSDAKRIAKRIAKGNASAMPPTTTSTTTVKDHTPEPPLPPVNVPAPHGAAVAHGDNGKSFKSWTTEDLRRHANEANKDGLLTPAEVEDFVGYWSEPSASGRLRLALEKTWDTRRRMQTALHAVFERQRVDRTKRVGGSYSTLPEG